MEHGFKGEPTVSITVGINRLKALRNPQTHLTHFHNERRIALLYYHLRIGDKTGVSWKVSPLNLIYYLR